MENLSRTSGAANTADASQPATDRCVPVNKPIPPMKDMTTDNITENVHIINSQCTDARTRYLLERAVTHLHDFAREVRLSTKEWQTAITFLTQIGQISTDLRHEMILLSDTLGLSMLVDSIDHPRTGDSTEGTVLGPFHTHDAPDTDLGYKLHTDPDATPLFVLCTVTDTSGNPIPNVTIDVWEGDSHGFYDVQMPNRTSADGRAVLHSNSKGLFYFNAIVPVPYPIPMDGPVGKMLAFLGRHPNRPGHVHFMMKKDGYDDLITALYPRGDPYETSDPVFGVKESLIVDLGEVIDEKMSKEYDVPLGTKLLRYDFVLVPEAEAKKLREEKAREAMEKLGLKMKFLDGLPVPEVD